MKIKLQNYYDKGCDCCGPTWGTYAWVNGEPVTMESNDPRYPQQISFSGEDAALIHILESLGHTVEYGEGDLIE